MGNCNCVASRLSSSPKESHNEKSCIYFSAGLSQLNHDLDSYLASITPSPRAPPLPVRVPTPLPPPPSFPPLLDPSTTLSDLSSRYTLAAPLGCGSYATVRLCTSLSTGIQFACKSIKKRILRSPSDRDSVLREISNMKKLSSEQSADQGLCRITKLHDVVEDSDSIHLIMELCRGGSLEKRLQRRQRNECGVRRNVDRRVFTETEAAVIAKSLLEALQACHSRGIMHRDIKPANVLFVDESNDSPIKLADFGLSTHTSASSNENVTADRSVAGTPIYMAPEIFESGSYGEQVDIWSVGVMLYILLSGTNPYNGVDADTQSIENAILYRHISFSGGDWNSVSAPAKDLMQGILCRDVKKRMSVSEALRHPWILQHCS